MSTQIDSLGLYNNPYALNYQNYANTGMNDDFLAQQLFAQQAAGQTQPAFQGYQQPQTDTFERSGSGLSTGLKLAAIGGLGTGAGVYFFGTNPIKDGKVNESLIRSISQEGFEKLKAEAYKELFEQKAKATFDSLEVKNLEQYNAIKKLATANKLEDLPEDIRKLLPDNIKTPKEAKDLVDLAKPELDKIDTKKLQTQAEKIVNNLSLENNTKQLTKLENIKSKIEKLPKDAKVDDLEKFFIDNSETFNLKGTNAEIAEKAKKIAAKHGTKENLLNLYQNRINTRKKYIEDLKNGFADTIKEQWDDTAKAFKKDTPDAIKNIYKNFKWKTAGKWAAIAAGAGLVLGCLFGGSNKA